MINISRNEFADNICDGTETFFKYRGIEYFFEGHYDPNIPDAPYACRIEIIPQNDYWQKIAEFSFKTVGERFRAIMNLRFLDGKTFEEAQDEIEFIAWG